MYMYRTVKGKKKSSLCGDMNYKCIGQSFPRDKNAIFYSLEKAAVSGVW